MAESVTLSDALMSDVRREAAATGRSLAAQITHWIELGRAFERGSVFAVAPSTQDEAAWLDAFVSKMSQPTSAERDFFAQRRALGKGVGLDASGNLIHASKSDNR